MDPVQEIKMRLDIIDIIREYIQLNQAGSNFKAKCPFHNEKTPSFMVSREKQIFKCFGCGVGGDIFEFVMKMEGCEFPEALRILAKKANVAITPQNPKIQSAKNRLMDLAEAASVFYHQKLLGFPQENFVRNYLKFRGITNETIEDLKIGYAPDSWDETLIFLKSKGFLESEIIALGLAIQKDNRTYDRFRNRLMFPLFDHQGQIVGFSGRELDSAQRGGNTDAATAAPGFMSGGKQAKYINSPQSLIYDKSKVLYGLNQAKTAIKEHSFVIVVEGQMDVVSCYQAGIKNTIASSGTALTSDQIKILKRYTNNIVASFDTDLAGQEALKRGIDAALAQDVNVKVLEMPKDEQGMPIAKDPDECLKKNPEAFLRAAKEAKNFTDYYFNKLKSECDLSLVEDKKRMAKELLAIIAKLADKVEQSHYIKKLAEVLDVKDDDLWSALPQNKVKQYGANSAGEKTAIKTGSSREKMEEESLLAIGIKYPEYLDYLIEHILPDMIEDESFRELYKILIIEYNKSNNNLNEGEHRNSGAGADAIKKLKSILPKELQNQTDVLYLLAERNFADFTEEEIKKEVIELVRFTKRNFIQKELRRVTKSLKQAEEANNQEEIQKITQEFEELTDWLGILEE